MAGWSAGCMRRLSSKMPLAGPPASLSFCSCRLSSRMTCSCGEREGTELGWTWSEEKRISSVNVTDGGRDVEFHSSYSSGTAAVMGAVELEPGYHHYWEVKMTRPVYGTNVMIGVAAKVIGLEGFRHSFASIIGRDDKSWGFSYLGYVQHGGKTSSYGSFKTKEAGQRTPETPVWGQGSIIGVHLDTFKGTLEFYVNRQPLGVAFHGLKNIPLYPIVSSTAARSGLKLICAQSFPASLQFACAQRLSQFWSSHSSSSTTGSSPLTYLPPGSPLTYLPPGIRKAVQDNYWFLFARTSCQQDNMDEDKENLLSNSSLDVSLEYEDDPWDNWDDGHVDPGFLTIHPGAAAATVSGGAAAALAVPPPLLIHSKRMENKNGCGGGGGGGESRNVSTAALKRRPRAASSTACMSTTTTPTSSPVRIMATRAKQSAAAAAAISSLPTSSASRYRDLSSSEEEDEAVFGPHPSDCRRRRLRHNQELGSGGVEISPAVACSSQDVHYIATRTPCGGGNSSATRRRHSPSPHNRLIGLKTTPQRRSSRQKADLPPSKDLVVTAAAAGNLAEAATGAMAKKRFLLRRENH